MFEHKVIGCVAIDKARGCAFYDEYARVVAGSEELMESYLNASVVVASGEMKKARYGEIKGAMMLGGKYLFDKDSLGWFK